MAYTSVERAIITEDENVIRSSGHDEEYPKVGKTDDSERAPSQYIKYRYW